jgi:hypothetical protein
LRADEIRSFSARELSVSGYQPRIIHFLYKLTFYSD